MWSCSFSDNTNPEHNYPYGLARIGKIDFRLDSVSSFSPFKIHYIKHNNAEYLMTDNKNLNTIDIYSFSTKKLVKRIEVNDSTHKYIRLIHGFWPITGDSVLVYNYQRISPLLLLLNDWQVTGRHEYNLQGFFKSWLNDRLSFGGIGQ